MNEPGSKMKLRIYPVKLLKSSIFWVIVLIVQVLLLYGITWYGYHNSHLPYWFDNVVQSSGLWRIYGKKEYEPTSIEPYELVNPKLNNVVKDTYASFVVRGYLVDVEKLDRAVEGLVIDLPESENVTFSGMYTVEAVFKSVCIDEEMCQSPAYLPGSLDDLQIGQLVELHFEKHARDAEWRIAQLNIADTYE